MNPERRTNHRVMVELTKTEVRALMALLAAAGATVEHTKLLGTLAGRLRVVEERDRLMRGEP